MKIAKFEIKKSFGKISYQFLSIDIINEFPLLNDKKSLIVGSEFYIKIDDDITDIEQSFELQHLNLTDKVIYLDHVDITNSMIGEVFKVESQGTTFKGHKLFMDENEFVSERVKKLYGKYFSIFNIR